MRDEKNVEIYQSDEFQHRVFRIPAGFVEAIIWLEEFKRYKCGSNLFGAILCIVT